MRNSEHWAPGAIIYATSRGKPGFYNEERPCGRGEELALLVVKNALALITKIAPGDPAQNEELALLVERGGGLLIHPHINRALGKERII